MKNHRKILFFAALSFLMGMLMSLAFIVTSHTTQPPSSSPIATIEGSMPTLYQLHENFWDTLSYSEKADIIQNILEIEAAHLGIPAPSLDLDQHLLSNNGTDVLSVVLTKCYEAYQTAQIEAWLSLKTYDQNLLLFRHIKQYHEESQYTEDEYTLQKLDARQYTLHRTQQYLNRIDNYLFKLERAKYN